MQNPQTKNDWKHAEKELKMKWSFPHCTGAVHRKHVEIHTLPGTGSYCFKYKHSFNLALMGTINAMLITNS
jgi:hypothetical protein